MWFFLKPRISRTSKGAPEHQVTLPWDDPHHDTEIGTEHLASMSKWITRTALEEGQRKLYPPLPRIYVFCLLTREDTDGVHLPLPNDGDYRSATISFPLEVALFIT